MENFRLIRSGIDVAPMLEELGRNEALWFQDTSRQDQVAIHSKTRVIILRSKMDVASEDKQVRESFPHSITYVSHRQAAATHFPSICRLVEDYAGSIGGLLARVAIVNLLPGCAVERHSDTGLYYKLRSRFHLVIKSTAGSRLISDDEEVTMHAGELWWIDNRKLHEAFNDSDDDRIHVIFDVLSPASFLSSVGRSVRFRSRQVLGMIRS